MKTLAGLLAASSALSSIALAQPQLAFPGADGMGRFAKGGRGGVVFQVTNLQDAGPGSLRACVEAPGPRTCVFTVAGDIFLQSELDVTSPFLTVAGQTAPGQGIQLRHGNNTRNGFSIEVGDVVIRHLKIRLGPTVTDSDIPNCFQIGPVNGSFPTDVIFDHISCSFTTDQALAINSPSDRLSITNSIFAYSLHDSTHPQGKHSKGPNFRGCGVSMIGSLISNHQIRNPNNTCGYDDGSTSRNGAGPSGEVEFRNNVVFNGQQAFYDYFNGRGESWSNLIGNVFVRGPNTLNKLIGTLPHGIYAVDAWDQTSRTTMSGTTDRQHLCLQDNIGVGLPTNLDGGEALNGVLNPNDAHLVASTDCINNPVGRAGDIRGVTGPVIASGAVEAAVRENAGAFHWNRDTLDARIVSELAARIGDIIDHPSEVGGWPVMASGTPYADADGDGMPDPWETTYGLNPANASDRNLDQDGDGFTNLEEFLSDRARDQVGMGNGAPPPPVISVSAPTLVMEGTNASACGAPYTEILVTFTRTGDLSGASSVLFDTGAGPSPSASSTDLCASFQTGAPINFAAGESVKTATRRVRRDGAVEADENVRFTIRDATGAGIGTASVVTTVLNDDAPLAVAAPVVTLRADSVRDAPAGIVIGRQPRDASGVIAAPAVRVAGTVWWPVDFDADPDGWMRQVSLKVK